MNTVQKKLFKNIASTLLRNSTVLIGFVLVVMIIITTIIAPSFTDPFNLQSLMRDISLIGLVAIGQCLLLLTGELDLSVGTMASLAGIFGGLLMTKAGFDPYLSFILGLLSGAVFGMINGLLVTKLRLNSMVTTIGMQGVYYGVSMVITKGKAITQIPDSIFFLGAGDILGIPVPFIITLIVVAIAVVFVTKTKTGRYIYAIGNSRPAAYILGIKVDRIRVLTFAIMGFLSAFAGMLCLARLGSAQASIGTNWPMNSIAACVIGGVLLTGGVGNPVGSLIGVAIISVISNVIVMIGVDPYWQSAVSGIVVLVAIALPSVLSILRERKRVKAIAEKQ